jgi:hypothetical protein
MSKSPFAPLVRLSAALLAACLVSAAAGAQASKPPAPSAKAAAPAAPSAVDKANNEMLARAATLYYSTTKAGLNGFDCDVRPDWHALFISANPGTPVAADDSRIVLLNSVTITMHARLKGGSSIVWVNAAQPADKPLDDDSTKMLDSMHQATEQTLQGFLQFWTPFMDGSVVPANSDGLEIAPTDKGGYKIHTESAGTTLTEIFSSSLLLEQFNVGLNGTTINFSPSYKSTDKGLLVSSFLAHIIPPGAKPEQGQEMHVGLEYQTIDGFPIPAKLNMEVVGTGVFNFSLAGCRTNPPAN